MPTYPISVSTPKRLPKRYPPDTGRVCAQKIEDYINEQAKDSKVTVLMYYEIADVTDIDKEIVRRCLMPLGGSRDGITINNPDFKDETGP